MGCSDLSGVRQEDRNADRRQEPDKGDSVERGRFAGQREIDGQDAKRQQPCQQLRCDEGTLPRRPDDIVAHGLMHKRVEIGAQLAHTLADQ
jgi:hypothetical protein